MPEKVANYCNDPILSEAGDEGEVPTDEYKLLSLNIIIRHGDRTPLHVIETKGVSTKSFRCYFDEHLIKNVPIIYDFTETMRQSKHAFESLETFKAFNFTTLFPDVMVCPPGVLTPLGAAQQLRNGLSLKNKYNKHNLLTESDFEKNVKIITTMYSRTFQSAIAFIYGFLPKFNLAKLNFEMRDMANMCKRNSKIKCDCPAVQKMENVFANSFEQTWTPHLLPMTDKHFYARVLERFNFNSNKPDPRPTPIWDFLVAHHCHNQTLDDCLLIDLHNHVNEHGVRMTKNGRYKKISILKMIPLLHEILNKLSYNEKMLLGQYRTKNLKRSVTVENNYDDDNGENAVPVKSNVNGVDEPATNHLPTVILYSGHDSTIEPIASSLGFADGHWPKYASRIVIEQYGKNSKNANNNNSSKSLLRILYNGKAVTHLTPFCRNVGDELQKFSLCPTSNFKTFVNEQLSGYRKDCHSMLVKRQNNLDGRERIR
ncbi:hypothetical protein HELRODRAFT_163822 [Helobdella robusta]|uniref:2-phosphoxylose phosphatase 1 n=1 Tax=Helobdella robusta TaxID=6412 RepID=T1EUI4_HELRO|nr:hypothetical protein HELRODRAFT_163822 [Helobdella robusta]ESN96724.1 hypothetical protein HELRODRAFT_163822 [Helobdella robusta]